MAEQGTRTRRQPPPAAAGGGCPGLPLTGRAAELARLLELLGATRNRAHLVEIVGEPGIGKTRLTREAVHAVARATGAALAWGGATEYEIQLPFAVFRAAFEDFLPGVDPAELATLDPDQLTLLRTIFPSLPGSGACPAEPPSVPAERFRLHRAVRALLECVAADQPLLVVLDDLHWADDGTLELCQHLLRHPPRAALTIVVAYRPRQAPTRLRAAIHEAATLGDATSIELGPLAFEDAATLLAPELDEPTRQRLYELSEGNPLYLEALSRQADTADFAGIPAGDHDPAEPVQLVLGTEIAGLEPAPLSVVRAAAIVGDVFEPAVVAEVAQVGIDVVLDGLDELVARDLVRPAGGDRHQFRHPLVRRAAYGGTGAGWRIAAHTRAADALRRRGAPAADQAHHVEQSGRGDTEAIEILVEAADTALYTAPTVAAHWFRAALRLLPDSADRLAVLDRLARALGMSGRLVESREAMHELLTLLPRSSERRAHAACFCAMIERLLGRYAEANAMLLTELADLTDADGATSVIIKTGLAFGYMLRGDFSAERDWAAEAEVTARRLGDQALLGSALTVRGLSILMGVRADGVAVGTRDCALHCLSEAATITDGLPDPELIEHIDAFAVLGSAEFMVERIVPAERHLLRIRQVARASGRVHLLTNVLLGLGSLYGRSGRLSQALACFDDALETALLTGSHEQLSLSLACRSWIMAYTGDIAGATSTAEKAASLAGSLPGYFSVTTRYRQAYVRYYAGDPEGCAKLLLSACGGPELSLLDPLSRLNGYAILTATATDRGLPDEALDWAERALAEATASPSSSHIGLANLAMSTALAESKPTEALQHADTAVEAFTRNGDRTFLGCAHLAAGRALGALGDDIPAARARFATARELFEASGAALFLRFTDREVRRMNARGSRARPLGLTEREREIAMLVAAGLTNRQIAEQLFLSARTVESHVAKVFTKLEVSTRSAIVHALTRGSGSPE